MAKICGPCPVPKGMARRPCLFMVPVRVTEVELKEYRRKHDYRYAHEPYGPEKDVWIRAIHLFVGSRGYGEST